MSRLVKVLIVANVLLLVWNVAGSSYAQRPPDTDVDGVPFLLEDFLQTEARVLRVFDDDYVTRVGHCCRSLS